MAALWRECEFVSEEELLGEIRRLEIDENVRFVRKRSRGERNIEEVESLSGYKVKFEDSGHPNNKQKEIIYDGYPFIVLGTELYECHQGAVLRQKGKEAIDGMGTDRKKRKVSQTLKANISQETVKEMLILAVFPTVECHQNHPVGEIAGYVQPVDKKIIQKIKDLSSGHRNVKSVKIILEDFVKNDLSPEASASNRRFYPSSSDIRSHMYHAVVGPSAHMAEDDQMQVAKLIHQWHESNPENKYFFRPLSSEASESTLLFVAQTAFQKALLEKYRQQMVLMDATYNVTWYDIPMYILCVSTNVGFYVVATFLISTDTAACVAEALRVVKNWTPQWKPKYFMVDFDLREIEALERTFEGVEYFLCDFHRDQAWQRWLTKNGIKDKKEVLYQLRKLASAAEEQEFSCLVERMRQCNVYKENSSFSNWLEKKVDSREKGKINSKRWAFCYRKDFFNIISMTNGLERQHLQMKKDYLKECGMGKQLCSVVQILVEKLKLGIKRCNAEILNAVRRYDENIPSFLKNRPKNFIKHCLKRLPPSVGIITEDDIVVIGRNYNVKSGDSGITYTVETEGPLQKCSCEDFRRRNWPCKHILSVVLHKGINQCLGTYFSAPIFTVDQLLYESTQSVPDSCEENGSQLPDSEMKDENDPASEQKARKNCLLVLGRVESKLYNGSSLSRLNEAHGRLCELENFVASCGNKVEGLPLRRRVKLKRLQRKRKTTSGATTCCNVAEDVKKSDP